jgi:hypothetical protein
MKWPLRSRPVPRAEIPLYNLLYLHAPGIELADSTMLWGTEIQAEGLLRLLESCRSHSPVLISTSHILLQATAQALAEHPRLNRRVVGRRVFAFRDINLRLAFQNPASGEVDVVLLRCAERCTLQEIAGIVWHTLLSSCRGEAPIDRDRRRMKGLPAWGFHALQAVYRWLDRRWALPTLGRLEDLRCSAVLVNDLSFRNAPPMRCYKPTRFPDESISVNITLGPMEEKVVIRDGQPAAGTVAPLFVRADHRIVDAYQLGRFVATLRDFLQQPAKLDGLAAEHRASMAGSSQPGVVQPAPESRKTA